MRIRIRIQIQGLKKMRIRIQGLQKCGPGSKTLESTIIIDMIIIIVVEKLSQKGYNTETVTADEHANRVPVRIR